MLSLSTGGLSAEPDSSPGVVSEKPASGPFVEVDGKFLVPYVEKIPGTNVSFEMIPVPGGEFLLGSPAEEAGRTDDEGPQVRIRTAPFWIGRSEVTWAEYHAYMDMYEGFKQLQIAAATAAGTDKAAATADGVLIRDHSREADQFGDGVQIDAVTSPTPLYDPSFTYGGGEDPQQPAVTMTQYAARQYTKWLSGVTQREYRLPSEAEWEYAARAGSTTAYSFGDDPVQLGEYAWLDDNADGRTHVVAGKKPNAWGLYDTLGNVGEWTLDEFAPDRYAKVREAFAEPVPAADAVLWPERLFPRVIRGGGWLDEADRCRTAARYMSDDEEWKLSDPNFPHSPWWYTEEPATAVGLRVIRPFAPMTADEKRRAWEADVDEVRQDVKMRLGEGRGAMGLPDPKLPAAIDAANRADAK